MLLRDFRATLPIPPEEQLYLLENPRFPTETGAFKVLPAQPGRLRRYLARKLRQPMLDLPARDSLLFIGEANRSWEEHTVLAALFRLIATHPRRRHVLLLGKSDIALDAEILSKFPPNLHAVIGNNVSAISPRLRVLPMGRDFRSKQEAGGVRPNPHPDTLVYCNFSVDTHPDRKRVHDMLRDKTDFVRFDHMGEFRQYTLTREAFFLRLGASKFSVCPRGNGLDTFRLWDSLALGVIPIVVREAALHREFDDLPILYLDRLEDFAALEPAQLERIHGEMMNREWNYAKLTLGHWLRRIHTLREELIGTPAASADR